MQSRSSVQVYPVVHPLHTVPPQSMSVSSPFCRPSTQDASVGDAVGDVEGDADGDNEGFAEGFGDGSAVGFLEGSTM